MRDLWQTRGGLEKYLTVERPPAELVDSYRTRGVAWAHEGKLDEAVADYQWAGLLYLDGKSVEQARERIDLLRRLGASDEAAALTKRIEEARPKSDLPR